MQTFRAGLTHPLDELRDECDRFWGTLAAAPLVHGWGIQPSGSIFPAVNIWETDDAVLIEAELPGLDAEDGEISVAGNKLVLQGARPECGAGNGNGSEKTTAQTAILWHRRLPPIVSA